MANKAVLTIEVLVDAAKGAAGLDQASGRVDKFSKGLDRATVPALGVGVAIGALAKKAGDSASRLQQSAGAVDSVFGAQASQIEEWAKTSSGSVGLASAEYQEMASVIGAQLKNLGTPLDQVAGKTDEMIRLGADLSATYGGTTTEAVQALGSALKGETDPIEKYGISVKNAAVEAAVGADKLKKMTDEQKTQAKSTALLGIVTEQAGGAIGAFGRESDSAAGQQQRANAAMEDASAQLGGVMLPLMAKASELLATFAGWVARNKTLVLVLAAAIGAVAAAIIGLNFALKAYKAIQAAITAATKAWAAVQWALNAAMTANPVGLVVLAVIALIAVIVLLWKKSDTFKSAVIACWDAIKKAAVAVWNGIKVAAGLFFKAVKIYFTVYKTIALLAFRVVKTVAIAVWNAIKTAAGAVFRAITTIIRREIEGVKTIIRGVKAVATAVWNAIKTAASTVWNAIQSVVRREIDGMKTIIRTIKTLANAIWDDIKNKAGTVWDAIARAVEKAKNAILRPIQAIENAFDNVIGAVESLIGWIGKIKFPKIPKLPGIGGDNTRSATTAAAGLTRRAGPRAGTATTSSSTVINVYGALDPVAVARQIRGLLDADDRRRGLVVVRGGTR